MKKYLSFLFLIFISVSISSAQVINNLVVFCNEDDKFILILNGQKYNETYMSTIKVENLNLEVYKVKVLFENPRIDDLNTTLTFFNTNKECVFGLMKKSKRKYSMDYVSSSDIIPMPVVKEEVYDTEYDNNTYSNSDNSSGNNSTSTSTNSNNNNTLQIKRNGVNIGVNQNGGVQIGTKDIGGVKIDPKSKSGNISIGSGENEIVLNKEAKVGCYNPLTPVQLFPIKNKITSQTSDDTKLITAKALLGNNCYTVSQLKEVMQLFSHDSTKLDYAKNAYAHANDLSNYYQLKSTLTEETSKKELQLFINDMKK